ncbi:hypothetical protein EDC01DRAFT_673793 [Geopyxis carbonaria]|nr:hypothetical protein EDC01DRAFT_673793 [Geopyxis carbonaria]
MLHRLPLLLLLLLRSLSPGLVDVASRLRRRRQRHPRRPPRRLRLHPRRLRRRRRVPPLQRRPQRRVQRNCCWLARRAFPPSAGTPRAAAPARRGRTAAALCAAACGRARSASARAFGLF